MFTTHYRLVVAFALFAIMATSPGFSRIMAQETGSSQMSVVRGFMSRIQQSTQLDKAEKAEARSEYEAITLKHKQLTEAVEKVNRDIDKFNQRATREWESKQADLMKRAQQINTLIEKHNGPNGRRVFGKGEEAALRRYNAEADRLNRMRDDFIFRGKQEEKQLYERLEREENQLVAKRRQRLRQVSEWVNGSGPGSPNAFVMRWGPKITLNSRALEQLKKLQKIGERAKASDRETAYRLLRNAFDNGGHSDSNVVDLRDIDTNQKIRPKRNR